MNKGGRYDYAWRDAGMEGVYFCRASANGPFIKTMDRGDFCYCVMVAAGCVMLEVDFPVRKTLKLSAGDLTTLSGLARHRFWTPGVEPTTALGLFERRPMDSHRPVGSVDLVLGVVPSEALALSSLMNGPVEVQVSKHPQVANRMWRVIDLVDAEYAQEDLGDRHLVLRRLGEIMEILLVRRFMLDRTDSGLFQGAAGMSVKHAVNAFVRTPNRLWTLEKLATEAGMSRTAFAKKFKSITGQTPARIVSRMRLTTIADRLVNEPLSIEAAAEDAGYSSAAAFVRAFQREFGETPARWRRLRQSVEMPPPRSPVRKERRSGKPSAGARANMAFTRD